MSDYDSYDEYDDKQDMFVDEFAARERAGGGRPSFININIEIEKGRKGRLSLKSQLTSDELFLFDLQKVYNKYYDEIQISPDDIEIIKNIVPKITYLNFKNPIAFLFAYYVLNKNSDAVDSINNSSLTKVKNILKNIEEVKIEDIIRYSRLIYKHI